MARKKKRKKTPTKVPVSKVALLARINRKLAGQGERLFARRGRAADRETMGDYYIIDTKKNIPIEFWVDLEDKARELGVLQPWERLADDTEGA